MPLLIPDAVQTSEFQLAPHPSDPTRLIVIDGAGVPVQGMTIVVGEAEAQGDVKHDSAKGPVVQSPNGTSYRLTVSDLGVVTGEEIA